jgi:plasminogen activator inhibitor 1 RNA-binding protein
LIVGERKDKPDWRGKNAHYKGKPRQGDHPFDRKSGTGRGRELNKGGHGKGNWGDVRDEIQGQQDAATIDKPTTEKVAEEGEHKEGEEGTTAQETEVKPQVQEEEEEEENTKELTLEEYLAQKKKSTIKKEARKAEELKKDNIERVETGKQKVETLESKIRGNETHTIASGKSDQNTLLGFQGEEDEYPRGDRPFRGGRGGRGRGQRTGGNRGGQQTGGRQGGRQQQLSVNEEAFPAL